MKRLLKDLVGGVAKNVSDVLGTAFLFAVKQCRKLNQRVLVDSILRLIELLCLFGGIYQLIGNMLSCLVLECGQQAVYVATMNPISIFIFLSLLLQRLISPSNADSMFMHAEDEQESEDEKPATPIEYDDYDRLQLDMMTDDGGPTVD